MHPLLPDLSTMTLDDLNARYNELSRKYAQASRMGSGSMLSQMIMIMEGYREEINRRNQKILDDANRNPNFKNIIDIK